MKERSVYMSIWDDYKTRVRTRINVKQDRLLLTERQWKLKHYVKLNDKCGKYLWVNAYCPNQELYLWDEEVRKMTDEELATYRAEYYGYDWENDTAHDSLADCRATLYCYQKMLKE